MPRDSPADGYWPLAYLAFRWSDPSLTSVNGNSEMRHQSDCGCALGAGRSERCREITGSEGRRCHFPQCVLADLCGLSLGAIHCGTPVARYCLPMRAIAG